MPQGGLPPHPRALDAELLSLRCCLGSWERIMAIPGLCTLGTSPMPYLMFILLFLIFFLTYSDLTDPC